jgi:hypothetical protein
MTPMARIVVLPSLAAVRWWHLDFPETVLRTMLFLIRGKKIQRKFYSGSLHTSSLSFSRQINQVGFVELFEISFAI